MKTIRLTDWLVPMLMPVMILTQVGCGGAPSDGAGSTTGVSSSAPATRAQALDGETVLRGVFFGQGPVASLFPETWNGTKSAAPAGALTNEGLIRGLSAQIDRMSAEGQSQAAVAKLTALRGQVQDGSVDATTLTASAKYDSVLVEAKIERVIVAMKSAEPSFFDSFGSDMQSGDHVRVERAYLRAQKSLLSAAAATDLTSNAGGSLQGGCAVLFIVLFVMFWVAVEKPMSTTAHPLEQDEYVDLMATRLSAT